MKTLTFQYSSSEAIQRVDAVSKHFGLLLADLDKKHHFIEVDLDHPFFRVFTVNLDAPVDFARIGLFSAHAALDYGKASDPQNHKHADFVFDAQDHGRKKFEVFMNAKHDTAYTYQVDYRFDPASGWDGQRFTYSLPARKTENRTLLINPYEDLGFLEIEVAPNRLDRGIIDSTEVQLKFDDSTGWSKKKTLVVTPDSQPQFWRLRTADPKSNTYTYRFVHRLKNGTKQETPWFTTQAQAVAVDDPFAGRALELTFIPTLDAARTRFVFLDVQYRDPVNKYERDERIKITPDAVDDIVMRISLMNPQKREFSYRLTFVGTDGKITRTPFVSTEDTEFFVKEP